MPDLLEQTKEESQLGEMPFNEFETSMDSSESFMPETSREPAQEDSFVLDRKVMDSIEKLKLAVTPENEREEVKLKQKREEIVRADTDSFLSTLGEGAEATAKFAGNVTVGAALELVQDTVNTGIDITNFVSEKFGNGLDIPNTDFVSRNLPDDDVSVFSREITKFFMGYGAILKAGKLITVGGKVANATKHIGSQMLSDFIINQPDADSLIQTLAKKLPIGADILEFVNSDPNDSNFEKRMKNSIFGLVEGATADMMFKAVKSIRNMRFLSKGVNGELPPPVENVIKEGAEGVPPKVPEKAPKTLEQPPEIPVTPREELPPIIDSPYVKANANPDKTIETVDRAKAVIAKQEAGEGAVNKIDFVTENGEKVYMNLTKFNNTDEFRKLISNTMESNPEFFSRKASSQEATKEMADRLGMEVEDFLKWTESNGLQRGQIYALNTIVDSVGNDLVEKIARRHELGISIEDLAPDLAYYEQLLKKSKEQSSMAGMLLNEAGMVVEKGTATGKLNAQTLKELRSVFGGDTEKIAKVIDDYNNPSMASKAFKWAVEKSHITSIANSMSQMRYASLLSNPMTHARNITHNFINIGTRVGEDIVAATINSFQRDPYGVQWGEVSSSIKGLAFGMRDVFQILGHKMKMTKEAPELLGVRAGANKVELVDQASGNAATDAFSFVKDHLIEGKFVGQALVFEDNLMKHLNARMTLQSEAWKKGYLAKTRGLNGKVIDAEQASKIVQDELSNPSNGVLKKMYQDAEYNTFTSPMTQGSLSSKIAKIANTPIGKVVAPFARTNLNAMKYKLERIPVANLLLSDFRKQLNHVNPAIRQRAIGKMTFASGVLGTLAAYLHSEDRIFGGGPRGIRKAQMFKEAGYVPNSIAVGEGENKKWITFDTNSPMGSLLSVLADTAQIVDAATDDDEFVQDAGLALTGMVAQIYNPEFLTDSVSKLIDAISKGDVKGAETLISFAGDIGSQYAPWSGVARQAVRVMSEGGKTKKSITDPSSLINTFKNKIMSIYQPSMLEDKLDMLGRPMLHKEGLANSLVNGFPTVVKSKDPVMVELALLSGATHLLAKEVKVPGFEDWSVGKEFAEFSLPSRVISQTIAGNTVKKKLDNVEYNKLLRYSAGIFSDDPNKNKDLTLESALKKTFTSPSYQKANFEKRKAMASDVISTFHRIGKKKYLGEAITTDLRRATIKAILQKYQ